MEEHEPHTVERLLERLGAGDSSAAPQLLDLLHDELHAVAHRHMSRQRAGHTLQTTALLNEAWMRLAPAAGDRWQDRQHFVRAAARAMRFVLVDHARRVLVGEEVGREGRALVELVDDRRVVDGVGVGFFAHNNQISFPYFPPKTISQLLLSTSYFDSPFFIFDPLSTRGCYLYAYLKKNEIIENIALKIGIPGIYIYF